MEINPLSVRSLYVSSDFILFYTIIKDANNMLLYKSISILSHYLIIFFYKWENIVRDIIIFYIHVI